MGNNKSQLTKEELQIYSELTFLSKKEILYTFTRFKAMCPEQIHDDKCARLPFEIIKEVPEFHNNPFADRIGVVFSSMRDGRLSFEDFLDLVSVLSESAPVKTKIQYAFRIYDFDDDGFLSRDDIKEMTCRLLGRNKLNKMEMKLLQDKILQEADLDRDGMLSPGEFEHFLMKCPDFANSFSLRM